MTDTNKKRTIQRRGVTAAVWMTIKDHAGEVLPYWDVVELLAPFWRLPEERTMGDFAHTIHSSFAYLRKHGCCDFNNTQFCVVEGTNWNYIPATSDDVNRPLLYNPAWGTLKKPWPEIAKVVSAKEPTKEYAVKKLYESPAMQAKGYVSKPLVMESDPEIKALLDGRNYEPAKPQPEQINPLTLNRPKMLTNDDVTVILSIIFPDGIPVEAWHKVAEWITATEQLLKFQ